MNLSLNFYAASTNCVNTGYSTVIVHEYGHFMVHQRGLAQHAFGEGFSDSQSIIYFGDPILGRNFFWSGLDVRNPDEANIQYPCVGQVHHCGQILGGLWWRLRQGLIQIYGESQGASLAQELHTNWFLATSGGLGMNAAHLSTVLEILTVDDDDANLENGSPHSQLICQVAQSHSLPCPLPSHFSIQELNPPDLLTPDESYNLRFNALVNDGSPVTSVRVISRINAGAWESTPTQYIPETGYWSVSIPRTTCLQQFYYYYEVTDSSGRTTRLPQFAPAQSLRIASAISRTTIAENSFADSGAWAIGHPAGNPLAPEDDADGNHSCWSTGLGSQSLIGTTYVISPEYNLPPNASLEFQAKEYARTLPNSGTVFLPQALYGTSNLSIGGSNMGTSGQWLDRNIISTTLPEGPFRIRYLAYSNNTAEMAFDSIRVSALHCEQPCPADFDSNGSVSVQDFYAFLTAWFAHLSSSDWDQNGQVETNDIFLFLSAWLQGC